MPALARLRTGAQVRQPSTVKRYWRLYRFSGFVDLHRLDVEALANMGKAFVVFGQVAQGNRPRYGNKARWRHNFTQLNAHDLLPQLY